MLRLLEVAFTTKEEPALYDSFADETALTGELETKYGQALKSDAIKAELLVAFDDTGKIYDCKHFSKDADAVLSHRVVWVYNSTANQAKCADLEKLEAEFYIKKGGAKKDATVNSSFVFGVDGCVVIFKDHWTRPVEIPEPEPEEIEE